MKQEIHTIPVVEALKSGDECPFCYLHRQAERRSIRYFAGPGASYMEPEVRGITNETGFCAEHMKKLYDYGNSLGNALMLQSHMESILLDLQRNGMEKKQKKGFLARKKEETSPLSTHLLQRTHRCAICDRVEENMQRQYRVFFSLLKEPEFCTMLEHSKGFCLTHYAKLLQEAESHLSIPQAEWFYSTIPALMAENWKRVKADLERLIAKHDYRNSDAPWGDAKDALQRAMQKLAGIYPADPPYRKD